MLKNICLFFLLVISPFQVFAQDISLLSEDEDDAVKITLTTNPQLQGFSGRKIYAYVKGLQYTEDSMVFDVLVALAKDPEFKVITEAFESADGGSDIAGLPYVLIFNFGETREVNYEDQPMPFGSIGGFQDVAISNTQKSEAVVREILIPMHQEANNQPTPSVETLVEFIKALNSSPNFTQADVIRYNPIAPVLEFENLTDEQFIAGVRNAGAIFKAFEDEGTFGIGGASFYIFGEGYPTNENFSYGFDVAYNVDKKELRDNMFLSVIAATNDTIRPNGEDWCGTENLMALQNQWVKQLNGWIETEGIFKFGDNLANKLSCTLQK